MTIWSIDPGKVNTGIVIGDEKGHIVFRLVCTGERAISRLDRNLGYNDVVVCEDVTPRRWAPPGYWSTTLTLAKLIGRIQQLAHERGAKVVLQNPSVIYKRGQKKRANDHAIEAEKHYRYYLKGISRA